MGRCLLIINNNEKSYYKRGYLKEDFLLFHLKDSKEEQFEFHYHDFYKIIVFISGSVTYLIEGSAYVLKPWDILLITNRDMHKALINAGEPYERIIIWFNPGFVEKNSSKDNNLLDCFNNCSKLKHYLLHPSPSELPVVKESFQKLEGTFKSKLFGTVTEKYALFFLLIVYLNRMLHGSGSQSRKFRNDDESINRIIDYINCNINTDLSIETLSKLFYMSRYTLMHKFKRQTGFTVHYFILQKRLILAGIKIKEGLSFNEAAYECGFTDYSSFSRAFRKFYGVSPRDY